MVCCSKLQTVASTDDYDTNTSPGTSETSYLDPLSKNRYDFKAFLWRNSFVLLTVAAVVIGFGLGFGLRFANMTDREIGFFTFPGELLMEMLQMLLLPLIVSSLITGISSIDMKACQKMGLHALCFYGVTTFMAVGTGIFVVSLIQPGKARNLISVSPVGQVKAMHTVDSFLDLMRNMFPPNLVIACFRTYKTVYSQSGVGNQTNDTVPMPGTAEGMNVLGLAVFCIAFGLILSHMENEAKPLKDFFSCLNKANMHLIWIVIWCSPAGIIFIIGGAILKLQDTTIMGQQLAMYFLTVLTGFAIHSLITLPLIYFTVTRKNPFTFMAGLSEILSTAFGTSSSITTLPITFRCLEENLRMNESVTRLVLPVASTLTMDGTALYEAVASIFIAQVYNMDLSVGQVIIISITTTVAAKGAAGLPQSGMVSLTLALASVGLPLEGVSHIIVVDWILDRLRTAVNVLGDCIAVGIVQHLSRHDLKSPAPGS